MAAATDLIKPFAIKSIAVRVSKDITETARRENLTTGHLVEKVWDHWKGDGAPLQVGEPAHVSPSDIAALMMAVAAMKTAGLSVPAGVRTLIAESTRTARGVPSRKPGRPAAEAQAVASAQTAAIPGRKPGQLAAPDKAA